MATTGTVSSIHVQKITVPFEFPVRADAVLALAVLRRRDAAR